MSGRHMSTPATPAHAIFAARLRRLMEAQGRTRQSLALELGVTPTMVGYWRAGRYLPAMRVMDLLVDALNDATLYNIVRDARTGHCPCGATFDREQTKRRYCSYACQRGAHGKDGRKADPRQDAIEAMCRACEPERICRDDSCALRPFSPFLFVALHRRTA